MTVTFDKPLAAALKLLSCDAIAGWPVVWRALETNAAFAGVFFATLGGDPFNKETLELIRHLREDQLAEMYIWLAQHSAVSHEEGTYGIVTPGQAVALLGRVVISQLGDRGTAAALEQIQRIRQILPDEQLDFLSKSTEERVRRDTWRPLQPSDLIDVVSSAGKKPQLTLTTTDTGSRMKQDLNLMRRIVLAVEDTPDGVAHSQPAVEGCSQAQIRYHVYLLVEKGLARGIDVTKMGNSDPQFLITGLTPNGHDFAELARNETRWGNAMAIAEDAGVMTLDNIRQVLSNLPGAKAHPVDPERLREDLDRGKERSAWLDARRGEKKWTSDLEIKTNGGPAYNTIDRYRSGKKSTRDAYVRQKFADLFGCELNEVPK